MTDSTVIDITKEPEDREFYRKFARLAQLAEDYEVDLLTNPRRHLDRARRIVQLEAALEAAYLALRPPVSWEMEPPQGPPPADIVGEALLRNTEAARIIGEALFGK